MPRPNRSRAKVLEAAAELAARRGVSATTVDDIAALAGVAKGSVYYSFPSKEAVFEALIDEAIARVSQRIRTARDGADDGVATAAVARALLVGLEEQPHVAKVVVGELFRTDRPWREALAGHRAVLLDEARGGARGRRPARRAARRRRPARRAGHGGLRAARVLARAHDRAVRRRRGA
ncbi:helix-turn-helix domain containing protein [Agrococcus sp. SL85]|uniref:TetR/AcrR family transcriptional regulator n=1 Tax=Agrococcus sp. SL85 TaxID=2995141 RepID=UPI00226D059F|nr:TetR/AcrR family transcriptional regulator [Agrococcus sp. SL85]WAC67261.1 helix-turn-helix domain containing protein [Agrococcus sp. SL85]